MGNWTEKSAHGAGLSCWDMHSSGILIERDRNQLCLNLARGTFIGSCNSKFKGCAVLWRSQIPEVSNAIWILTICFHSSPLPSSVLTFFP